MRILKTNDWFQNDDCPLALERRAPQERCGPYSHEFCEIVIILAGRALHVTSHESRPVAAGDVFVVGGSEVHEYREMEDLRLVNILFRPEKLQMELLDLPILPGYLALSLPLIRQVARPAGKYDTAACAKGADHRTQPRRETWPRA